MERITEKQIALKIDHLNKITGNPVEPYRRDGESFRPQKGNYHIDIAYGGYSLCQMISNDNGGVRTIIDRCTKRELYNQIQQLISGITIGKGV